MPFLGELFGNPHSNGHRFGWETSRAIRDARARVADLINADDDEIVFTSGATESCNLALRGIANRSGNGRRNRIVTLATEHPAVLETVLDLGRSGFDTVVLPVGPDGLLNLDHLDKVLDERTLIVSIMAANNEIGVLQPIADIAVRCQAAGALFHTDATQAAGRLPIDVDDWQVDLLSFSSHKIYGPKGVGALFVRSGLRLKPIITGGSQEGWLRAGTLPPALIVGFGAACELAATRQEEDQARMQTLTKRLYTGLREAHPTMRLFGHAARRLAGSLNIGYRGSRPRRSSATSRITSPSQAARRAHPRHRSLPECCCPSASIRRPPPPGSASAWAASRRRKKSKRQSPHCPGSSHFHVEPDHHAQSCSRSALRPRNERRLYQGEIAKN